MSDIDIRNNYNCEFNYFSCCGLSCSIDGITMYKRR